MKWDKVGQVGHGISTALGKCSFNTIFILIIKVFHAPWLKSISMMPLSLSIQSQRLLLDSCNMNTTYNSIKLFIPCHFKKCRVLCYTLHTKNCVWVSLHLYVHRFHSLLGAFFNQFSSNLFFYIYCTQSHLTIMAGVLCTLRVAGWKPTSNDI